MITLYSLHFEGAIWISTKPIIIDGSEPKARIITQKRFTFLNSWYSSIFGVDSPTRRVFKTEQEAFDWLVEKS
jgi:hypothetical protein